MSESTGLVAFHILWLFVGVAWTGNISMKREWNPPAGTRIIVADPDIAEVDRFSYASCADSRFRRKVCDVIVESNGTARNCTVELEPQVRIHLHEYLVPFGDSVLLVWTDDNQEKETELRIRFVRMDNCESRDVSFVTGITPYVKIVPFHDAVDVIYMHKKWSLGEVTVNKASFHQNGTQIGETRPMFKKIPDEWILMFAYIFPPLDQIRPILYDDREKGYFFVGTRDLLVRGIGIVGPNAEERNAKVISIQTLPQLTYNGCGKIILFHKEGNDSVRVLQFDEELNVFRNFTYDVSENKIVKFFIPGPDELLLLSGNDAKHGSDQLLYLQKVDLDGKLSERLLLDSLKLEDEDENIPHDFYSSFINQQFCINILTRKQSRKYASKLQIACTPLENIKF